MNKNVTKIILLILVAGIMIAITWDFIHKQPGRNAEGNPWEYNVDEFKYVKDTTLIKYNEILNIQLDTSELYGIAYAGEKIYIIGGNYLQVISTDGRELFRKELVNKPFALTVSVNRIFIAYLGNVETYTLEGEFINQWNIEVKEPHITSIAGFGEDIFIADAANRIVLRYNIDGKLIGTIEGKTEAGQIHGFIVPSVYFDLNVSQDGELWVVNPGKHALEHYSFDGRQMKYWQKTSFGPEGFSGCCNPVHIAILSDGSFVTSEKGITRIKIHKPYGDFYGYVASPEKFNDGDSAPDIAVSPEGLIYALDFNRNTVRIFKHKE